MMIQHIALKMKQLFKEQEGVAAVETILIIMVFLMLVFGLIQLSLVFNAKLMANYAAFCACRAGIVHNADADKMKQAAQIALAPIYQKSNLNLQNLTSMDLSAIPVNLEVIHRPWAQHFFPEHQNRFTRTQELDATLLVIRVSHIYPLEIPLVGRIFHPSGYLKITSECAMRMQSDHIIH